MTFEIIKSFLAIAATIHSLTGSRAKLADEFGMERVTMRALNSFLLKHFRYTKLLPGIRWRNSKFF